MDNPNIDPKSVSEDLNPDTSTNPDLISNPNSEENLSTKHMPLDSVKSSKKKSASLRKHQEDKKTNNPINSSQPVNNNVDRPKDLEEGCDYFGERTDSGRIRTPVTRLSQQSKRKRVTRDAFSNDTSGSDYEEEEEDNDDDEDDDDDYDDDDRPRRSNKRKTGDFVGWASNALINFLHEIGEDSEKRLLITAVNKIVLNYIETNELAHPQRRAQVRCDEKLHTLFQKKNVRKYEIMKLLRAHVASKKRVGAKVPKAPKAPKAPKTSDDEDEDDAELENSDERQQKHRKSKKNIVDTRELKPDANDYAAIDVKNINLIYLKRSLLDYLREDPNFESKIVGTFVRIRVPAMTNKTEACYRLVQVIGIKNVKETQNAKVGDMILEILNLQKREEVNVDAVSSHDFTEEECQRLRQCVKCGLLNAMTVGQLEEKARALREAKVKDWFENELVRLSHLRDRASEKGRKKELRECVEKLQVLSSPAQRERQLKAPIDINIDPHMDPEYESDNADDLSANSIGNQSDWDNSSIQKVREKTAPVETSQNVGNKGNLAEADPLSRMNMNECKSNSFRNRDNSGQLQRWVHESSVERWDNGTINTDNSSVSWNHQKNFPKKDDIWGDSVEINYQKDEKWQGNSGGSKKISLDDNINERSYRMDIRNDHKFDEDQDDGWRKRGRCIEAEGPSNTYYVDSKSNNEGNKNYESWRCISDRMDDGSNNLGKNDFERNGYARKDHDFDEWGGGRVSDGRWFGNFSQETRDNGGITSTNDNFLRSNSGGNTNGWHSMGVRNTVDDMGGRNINYFGTKPNTIGYIEQSDGSNGQNGGLSRREWIDSKSPYIHREAYDMLSGRATHLQVYMAVDENEKIWYYHDPTKKAQGPFTMVQLRQWEKTKLFPQDLRVWRTTETPQDGILLTDLLQLKLGKEFHPGFVENHRDFGNASNTISGWDTQKGNYGAVEKPDRVPHDGGSRQERSWESTQGLPRYDVERGNFGRERGSIDYHPHRPDQRANGFGRFPTSKKDCPCRYFERGMCSKGRDCEFKH